ncbi:MAG: hypothetical protein Q7S09_03655 [bacterium]|nr:hypothetical protein [bacterium]
MSRIRITILVGIAASFTLLACWLLFFRGQPSDLLGDSIRWDELARSVASGTGLQPPRLPWVMDREPFYAVFAGAVYWVFGAHPGYVLFAQSALLVLVLMFLAWVLVPLFGLLATAAISLATIAAPGVAAMAVGYLLAETVALILAVAIFLVFISGFRHPKNLRYFFLAGLFLGALALTRYIFYPLPFFLVAGLFLLKKRMGIVSPGRISVWILAGFLVPTIIWTVYISLALGTFTPVGTKGGHELLLNAYRAELTGKNLFAFAVGASLGDAAGQHLFPAYTREVEPYFANEKVRNRINENLIKRREEGGYSNNAALREAASFVLAHPFRFSIIGISEFFVRSSTMLWHNAADMRQLFSQTHPELPLWFKIISASGYRLVGIGVALFALGVAVSVLLKPTIPLYLFFPAVTVLAINTLHFFFESVPRHALPLYPLYFLLCVFSVRLWRRRADNRAI